jgi:thiol-disulfide isomerase/thioredoxin
MEEPDIDVGGSKVVKLKKASDADALLKDDGPILMVYYAKWCGHCQGMYDTWKDLSNQVDGKAKVYMIESANYPGVKSFPTMKVVKKGKAVEYDGDRDVDSLKNALLMSSRGGRRRRTSRLRNRRRKISHRTLRRNVPLVK